MTKQVTLAVKELRKTIRGKEIIKGISFELHEGEVFGFLGPNGAGKTTTIRMLVGLIRPTSGTVVICGYDLHRQFTDAIRQIGCIVENPEMYPYLTGWENLEHFARMIPGIGADRIMEVAKLVGLEQRIHDRVGTYSLGMRQRLGIAQALLGKPKVLILDEPTNGLDPAGIREMRAFIRFLAETEGLSVLVSSHLLSEIQLMCDRVAIMAKGRLLAVDTVERLLNQQARVVWKAAPTDRARALLAAETEVLRADEETIVTPYEPSRLAAWNAKLVQAGVSVSEIEPRLPTLEDLFIELTGGETIE
ncbi:ABC transporter ATP-binding protein [Geobacillus sp. FSL K6-0789]|uniref:ABC transporter ATP-binding protein n=1 Tax=Geobacillus stearothermophilus TaxID=1422 RepID=A0A0K9HZS7_GEOSE|nr:ABC transporter ATP-binding protein [Geobacillus stearothermophilus]KAF6511565.1 ABC transporter ATP-binding protein [Geobacillus stearothermophilus]KMY59975.1 ABC transporter ATP-binding protein [Geobacillus stearothermophilus]KMY60043.1 ABC transporter ATP-binding protein [Geobacillus stearothermophilus]KMY63787.1 ABC transporter ATP-binding protein [Geobacillus stearothermophilus]MED3665268.1 ABC transporter ATP-binding protein [Geobacillus stearothermophilus]